MTRITSLLKGAVLAASIGLLVGAAHPAQAQNIAGGNGSNWEISNNTNGLVINDAQLPGYGDAFDTALVTSVNGTFVGFGTPTQNGQFVSVTDTTSIAGLSVFKQFYVSPTLPVLRTYVTLTNTSGATLTNLLFSIQNNVGSDGFTQTIGTSSGDTVFTTADRYIITDDSPTVDDPTNTHVLYGNGGLQPSSVSNTVTIGSSGSEGVGVNFTLASLASGETAGFVFFNRLDSTAAEATANVSLFDSSASIANAGLLSGMSATDIAQVRNFNLTTSASAAAPEPGSCALLVMGALPVVGIIVRRRRA